MPSGPTEGVRMASTLTFKLETVDGTPADPPSFTTVAPLWRAGDTIPLGPRTLRVVDVRQPDPDVPPILVVESPSDHHFRPFPTVFRSFSESPVTRLQRRAVPQLL